MDEEPSAPIDRPRTVPKLTESLKVVKVAGLLPDATPDLAKKIVEQVPNFTKFGRNAVKSIESIYAKTLEADQESSKQLDSELDIERETLLAELEREGLSEEHRRFVLQQLMEVGRRRFEKTRDKRRFLRDVNGSAVAAVVAIAAIGAVVLLNQGSDGAKSLKG